MAAVMVLFAILTWIGGVLYGGSLIGSPLTRTTGILVLASSFTGGMFWMALYVILRRLEDIQVIVGRPSR